MTKPVHHRLNVRERFAVTSYLLNNLDAVWALPTQEARAKYVGDALNLPLTVAKLQTAAGAGNVSLSPPSSTKAPKAPSKAELMQIISILHDRVDALHDRVDALRNRVDDLGLAQKAAKAPETDSPTFDFSPVTPRAAYTLSGNR